MKVYAVKRGNKTGVFENWSECQAATKGFSGAEFKSFATREEAEVYLEDRDVWVEQVEKDNAEGYLVAFTDGSFDKDLKDTHMEFSLFCLMAVSLIFADMEVILSI